jgi:hypothetical protein
MLHERNTEGPVCKGIFVPVLANRFCPVFPRLDCSSGEVQISLFESDCKNYAKSFGFGNEKKAGRKKAD